MIVAKTVEDDAPVSQSLFLILEPGDVEFIKKGMPLIREIKEIVPSLNTELHLMITYTPDPIFVEQNLCEGVGLVDALLSSLDRAPVVRPAVANNEALTLMEIMEINTEGQVVADDVLGRIYTRVVTADEGTSCYEYGFSLSVSPSSVQWGYFDIDAVTEARRHAYDDYDPS